MPKDMRWLQLRGPTFYFVRLVSRPLQAAAGKRLIVKSLQTHQHAVAVKRRLVAAVEFDREMDALRLREDEKTNGPTASALEWRAILPRLTLAAREEAQEHIAEEAETIEEVHGHAPALAFFELATGRSTPLLHHMESWLVEGGPRGRVKVHTADQYRADVETLRAWLEAQGIPATVEAVTRKVAGQYVNSTLAGLNRATANRKISAPSSYWRWMIKRAAVESNPWANQSFAKSAAVNGREDSKRPFTDTEVAALLTGEPDAELADAIRLALLTGARIGELYGLTVQQCADGWFDIRAAKTRAGVRRVPIHPDLVAIVERRIAGKSPSEYLMHEPTVARRAGTKLIEGRTRAASVSKRFGRYRQTVGVHQNLEGTRNSLVDLHSARRWFITKARAGFDRAVVAAVVGHEAGNITDDTYSGGPSESAKVACVASVRLP